MTVHRLLKVVNGVKTLQDIDIPASASGANSGQVEVDFGFASGGEGDSATATVSASWVDANSIILCSPSGEATADHDPEDYGHDGIIAFVSSITPGVGFNITAKALNNSWGRFMINWIGV